MSHALLPIDHKGMTCREAADLLTGMAALIEAYPVKGVVVTLNIEVADTGNPGAGSKTRKSRTAKA